MAAMIRRSSAHSFGSGGAHGIHKPPDFAYFQ
jgi:hypothetical protein